MRVLILCAAFCFGQMNTLQEKPVVHGNSSTRAIRISYGGKLLELANAPDVVHLPASPPKADSEGVRWLVEVKNLGPREVTIRDEKVLSIPVEVGQTVKIESDGLRYSVKH
jgi:hypothetical protein